MAKIEDLKGKTVKKAILENNCLTVTFEDGTTLSAAAKSGPRADGGWYSWTAVDMSVPGQGSVKIIDE